LDPNQKKDPDPETPNMQIQCGSGSETLENWRKGEGIQRKRRKRCVMKNDE